MAFVCPECLRPKSLEISAKIELPGDSRSDEIAVQVVECAECGFAGIAVYEESRRGALDSECVDHAGFRVSAEDLRAVRGVIGECPDPKNSRCGCAAHRRLGKKNDSGRWCGLDDVEREGRFPMRP